MTNPADYQRVVRGSRLLNEYQKEAFLDHPEDLPDYFKRDIVTLLSGFDERSIAREQDYKEALQKVFDEYRQKLQALGGASEEERAKLLSEADRLESACMAQFSSPSPL